MFSLYYFILQILIWKVISDYFLWFHYWILKEWKAAKAENQSVFSTLTFYTNDWSIFWHVYWYHVYSYFYEIPKNVQAKNRLAHLDWNFMKWANKATGLAGNGEPRLTRFHPIRNLSFFKAAPSDRLPFYLGIPLHVISSLFSHFCLFQNAIFRKLLEPGFWNFKPIFLRMQFSLVAKKFSVVLVISFRWYFHLTVSYLILLNWHFGNQMVFPNI